MPIPTPRPAATVIVLRDRSPERPREGYEIFMVKRHEKSAFMAGALVFPGGRVDDSDLLPDWEGFCDGIKEAADHFPDLDPEVCLSYHIAAIRELFEEAGVLLARSHDGTFVDFFDPEVKTRFDGYRQSVHDGFLPLPMILKEEMLRFALDELAPFDHWITPEIESHRFDARFFVSRIPHGQIPLHDKEETVGSTWITPTDALQGYYEHKLTLAPPTLRILEDLCELPTVQAVLDSTISKRFIPKQPHIYPHTDQLTMLLPGDPLYPVSYGIEKEGKTRVVMEDGRWRTRYPHEHPLGDERAGSS